MLIMGVSTDTQCWSSGPSLRIGVKWGGGILWCSCDLLTGVGHRGVKGQEG